MKESRQSRPRSRSSRDRQKSPRASASGNEASLDAVRDMVRTIVARFDPNMVILFGSRARGTGGSDSDVDLLVVMPVTGLKREKQIEIRLALRDFGLPLDIVVTTPEDFTWRKAATDRRRVDWDLLARRIDQLLGYALTWKRHDGLRSTAGLP